MRSSSRYGSALADLKDARSLSEAMPKGWFSWTRTSKRRAAAIEEAAAALKEWQGAGTIDFIQREAAKMERARLRQDRKIRDFDVRPDVVQASRRLDDMPGVMRMASGLAELEPDKELHAALMPVVSQEGTLLRVNADAGLALLRRRVAIAAAVQGAGGRSGGPKDTMEPEPAAVVTASWEQAAAMGLDDLAMLGM
ncbi:BTAD domain-containing putative transcriptional regulator [Gluconobacter sphaericus]|uniref:BTAD domain-containing putative transcriptional regulator n=1 Tax=Gluconobacter sphaericus TaxID=574987 RepID=UPI001F2ABF54|nr:BTAD domain-containing putative transcriptional regulator [Gluconobacter sphaericus]